MAQRVLEGEEAPVGVAEEDHAVVAEVIAEGVGVVGEGPVVDLRPVGGLVGGAVAPVVVVDDGRLAAEGVEPGPQRRVVEAEAPVHGEQRAAGAMGLVEELGSVDVQVHGCSPFLGGG